MWDPTDNRRKFVNNRYFMALRGNEVSQISNFQVSIDREGASSVAINIDVKKDASREERENERENT